jgi:hypothetical protein
VLQSRLEPLQLLLGRPAVAHGCRSCRRSGWGPEFLATGPAAAPLRFRIGARESGGSLGIGWVGMAGVEGILWAGQPARGETAAARSGVGGGVGFG